MTGKIFREVSKLSGMSDEGLEFSGQCRGFLEGLFRQWIRKGYSPEEITGMIVHVAVDAKCTVILDSREKEARKDTEKDQG